MPPTLTAHITFTKERDGSKPASTWLTDKVTEKPGAFIPTYYYLLQNGGGYANYYSHPFILRRITSFKVNGVETIEIEPIVEVASVYPIATVINTGEESEEPSFTEESYISGVDTISVKFSKEPTQLGISMIAESLGGSEVVHGDTEGMLSDEFFGGFLEKISDTEFKFNVNLLIEMFNEQLAGSGISLGRDDIKILLWGCDEVNVENINSFAPVISGYQGGYMTTCGNFQKWPAGDYEVKISFDPESVPDLDRFFFVGIFNPGPVDEFYDGSSILNKLKIEGSFNHEQPVKCFTTFGTDEQWDDPRHCVYPEGILDLSKFTKIPSCLEYNKPAGSTILVPPSLYDEWIVTEGWVDIADNIHPAE